MPYKDPIKYKEYQRAYHAAYRVAHPPKHDPEYQALWRAAHPEYHAAWRATHPEQRVKSNAKWYAAHPTYHAEWNARHKEQGAARTAIRRARKLGQFVERVYKSIVFDRDGGLCGICQEAVDPQDWHLDHIKPLSRGGEHSYKNTQVSHPVCNMRKGCA